MKKIIALAFAASIFGAYGSQAYGKTCSNAPVNVHLSWVWGNKDTCAKSPSYSASECRGYKSWQMLNKAQCQAALKQCAQLVTTYKRTHGAKNFWSISCSVQ